MEHCRKKLLFFMVVFLISLLACSTFSNNGVSIQNTLDSNTPSQANDNEAISPPSSGLSTGPNVMNLENPNLFIIEGNYLSDFLYSFSEMETSQIFGGIHMFGKTVVDPEEGLDFEFTLEGVAASDEMSYIHSVSTPDREYVYIPETGCLTFNKDEFESPLNPFSDTDGMFVGEAQRVEKDVLVNGVLADKYTLNNDNLQFDDIEFGDTFDLDEGSIWVAHEGYMLKIYMSGTGTSATITSDPELLGNILYEFNFTPVPDPIQIFPPSECDLEASGAPISSLPMTDDAININTLGDDFLSYNTFYSMDALVNFFKEEMAANGFNLDSEIVVGTLITLRFINGEELIDILAISEDTGGFYVTIIKEQ